MRPVLLFLIGCLSLTSCHQEIELFNNQFVEGRVIAKALNDEFGLMKMSNDHDYAYLALYSGEDLEVSDINKDTYYFKVKELNGIPIAHSFSDKKGQKNLYIHDPITSMRFHSLTRNDHSDFIHRKAHIGGPKNFGSIATYSYEFNLQVGGLEVLHTDDPAMNNKIISFGDGRVWVEFDENKFITSLDTCHYHTSGKIVCRSDPEANY